MADKTETTEPASTGASPAAAPGRSATGAPAATLTAGGALLARLKAVGVDVIFANSGTDFPPVIEGLAEAAAKDLALPRALVMPHEGAAMAMAHGYYLATGRPQAVMAHTNVGLANCAIGAINAALEQIPVLLFSGRTPTVEQGRFGARSVPIGWGQEMRDQAALVREASKWDYELRFPEQVPELVDRMMAIASSSPKGPVYMSLPREVLCQPCPTAGLDAPLSMQPARSVPDPAGIAEAARLLAAAERPVIFSQRGPGPLGPGGAEGVETFRRLVEDWAIPVVNYWAVRLALPTDHPLSAGADPLPWLAEADVVLVLDALAPWSPDIHSPAPGAKVIQLAPDPLCARVPVRNFRSDLTLACETAAGVAALAEALASLRAGREAAVEARRARVTERTAATRRKALDAAAAGSGRPMTKEWAARCLSDALAGKHATVLSELGCPLAPMALGNHDSWYQEPHAGGLGWSFPAGLGMALADQSGAPGIDPGRLVVATMGDGSYLFANPVACHQIAEALALPLLVVILNNAEWGAVRHSVLGLYPEGHAAKANAMPLTSLAPTPDFVKVAEASRAWARRVEDGAELPAVLAEAIGHVEREKTLALVEVRVRA
ncbi:acetolactate synthase-1/2/3 large subunit [Tistlia consotensis]|uniref:Acetolactate synthase-1/2/3 large subunit n=1 Tax=Tistlia consotensis USBA 355 TaxID=560819 RepID=A0A1Y6CMI8_9PROT|nr:thiamine pyrophosphate-requiring protein [Tistlia consotensis]SMF77875.1 acetolactate synthase-1/2/3 large subunit [Tistlia consotensis USBA 355]SNS20197.1 acetolactate synthase-1/2/3 large subunit [Tistlia consotensis]